MNLILTTAYFPPIEYIALIENKSAVFIEGDENYQRQSYRNRMLIVTANGVQQLYSVVQNHSKTKIRDVEVDYKRNGKSNTGEPLRQPITIAPFSLFSRLFSTFLREKHKFLFDFNTELLAVLLKLCQINKNFIYRRISGFL